MRRIGALAAVIGALGAAGCADLDWYSRAATAPAEARVCWRPLTESRPHPYEYTLRRSDARVCATSSAISDYEAKSDIIDTFCTEAACYRDDTRREFSPSLCTLYDRLMTYQARHITLESRAIRHSAEHGAWLRRTEDSRYPLAMSYGFDLLALEEAEHCAWWHEELAARLERKRLRREHVAQRVAD